MRGHYKLLFKGKTYWRSCRPAVENNCCSSLSTWNMQLVKSGSVGNIKVLPPAKMPLVPMNFFLQRVDYD